jgi:hypothetical protein
MKKFFMILVTLVFLAGCATSGNLTKDQFMSRAAAFDQVQKGLERTEHYQFCYQFFFNHLFTECVDPAMERYEPGQVPDDDQYWQCAWDALTLFEDCLGGE